LKAIIVDIEEKYLIVATKKGLFKKVKNTFSHCQVGDEIDLPEEIWLLKALKTVGANTLQGLRGMPLRKIAASFVILFFLVGGYAVADYMRPVTFVTMDINPSFELCLNRYQRVLDVKGLSNDSEQIAKQVKVKNLLVDQALKALLREVKSGDFLRDEQSTVMLAVSNVNDAVPTGLLDKLEKTAKEEFEEFEPVPAESKAQTLEETQSSSGPNTPS
jgi:hypothetical protein